MQLTQTPSLMKRSHLFRSTKTIRPQTNHQNAARRRKYRPLFLLLFAAFLAIAGASKLKASTWNANQVLHGGNISSSSGIPWDYDIDPNPVPPNPIPVGSLGHIAYGIQDPAGNTTPVSLIITTPTGFHVTGGFCVRFSGPPQPPINPSNLSSGCTITPGASVHNIAVGVLNKNDKVIVIINGYFDQAGSQAATFAPSGPGTQPQNLNWNVYGANLPVDIVLTQEVKPKTTGAFGSSATLPIWPNAGTVTYKLKVKNQSAPDLVRHTTDVYLGKLLRLNETFSTPANPQDVNLGIVVNNFQCTKSTGSVDCPGPISDSFGLGVPGSHNLPTITYPALSPGFLPAGESFEITFDATITNGSQCSANNNNKLLSQAFLTYSNGTTTVNDTNASNNTSGITTTYLQLPNLPTTCTASATVLASKTVQTVGSWNPNTPFTYVITVTNPSTAALTGLTLTDWVGGNGVPPFTATPSGVVCTPAASCGTPTTYTPTLSSASSGTLFTMPLTIGPNGVVTIKYNVQYSAACASAATAGSIWNYVYVGGPATGSAYVSNAMPSLPICQLQVTKSESPISPPIGSYPATINYVVKYKNTSSGPITVRTLIDAISLDSPLYATSMDIAYSYTCINNGVTNVTAPLNYNSSSSSAVPSIHPSNPLWSGTKLIDFSTPAGMVFSAGGSLTFNVSVTLKQPPTGDALCQNAGITNVANTAFMDPSYPYNTNLAQVPAFYAKVTKPLPKCVSLVVGKSGPTTAYGGGPVTFTLTVKNAGSDISPAGMKLSDTMVGFFAPFTGPFSITGAGGTGSFSTNALTFNLAAIPAGGTTSFQVTANAPVVTQPTPLCNRVDVRIAPGGTAPAYLPPLTFFEGNQAALTTAQACIQIVPPPPPTLGKKFSPAVITLGQPVDVVFTLSNAAGSPAQTGLGFSDALPNPPFPAPGTTATVTNTCGGTASTNFNIVKLQNASLPAGPSSCTVTYHMSPPTTCGLFHNTAQNIHEPRGLDFSQLSADLQVKCKPTMEKRFDPAVINLGQPVNVIITLTNPPSSPAQNGLVFFDNLPSPPFTGGTVLGNTCGGNANVSSTGTISLTGGSLPPGPSSCQITYVMKPPTKCGTFHNTAHNIAKSNLDFSHLAANLTVKCDVQGEIRKVLTGVSANYAGQFNFNVTCSPPGSGPVTSVSTVSIAASDPLLPYKAGTKAKIKTVAFGPFPPGTTCTVTEVAPVPPPNCSWLPPVLSPSNGNMTLTAPGPVPVIVQNRLTCGKVIDSAGPSTTLPGTSVFTTPTPSPSPSASPNKPKDLPILPRPLPTGATKSDIKKPSVEAPPGSGPRKSEPRKASPTPTPGLGR